MALNRPRMPLARLAWQKGVGGQVERKDGPWGHLRPKQALL